MVPAMTLFYFLIGIKMRPAGTELYRERLVRALARDLQVPLLVLDSSVLAPYVRLLHSEYFSLFKRFFSFCVEQK